uniref:Protein PFC0760c-like n=1 Tax=Diabrotica virgifera virgifera TaxID=50390 RepID=A0A6P7FZX5_DIAVI
MALHVVAYGDKGLPRQTRKNLWNFTNFAWDKESQEYSTKIDDIKNKLRMPDLVAVLDLHYTGSEDDVIERICSFLNDFNLKYENDDEDEDASDDDGDKDVYHKENGKDVTEDDRYNEDNDANSDKDAYHEEEGKAFTDDDNNDNDMDDERTTDLFTRYRSKSNKITGGRMNHSNDLQMLIFAKRSLKGIAKLYIQSEKGVNSWKLLKKRLTTEFENKINSAEIHKMLMNRKKKQGESVQEYVLKMREIGS